MDGLTVVDAGDDSFVLVALGGKVDVFLEVGSGATRFGELVIVLGILDAAAKTVNKGP